MALMIVNQLYGKFLQQDDPIENTFEITIRKRRINNTQPFHSI